MTANVFLSYAKPDRDLAQSLAHELAETGIAITFADELPRGTKWADALRSKLDQSDGAIFIASDASLNNAQVMIELGAFGQSKKPIVAVQPAGAERPRADSPFSLVPIIDASQLTTTQLADKIKAVIEVTP